MEILTNTEALAHCRQLSNLIDSEVKKSFGWLPFSHYMELALYAPNLGYYTAGSIKFGSQGDFITAKSNNPIRAYDTDGNEIKGILIGNGSKAKAVIGYYDWKSPAGQAGRSPSLMKLVVTDLIAYNGGAEVTEVALDEAL